MLSLIGALLGFAGSAVPSVIDHFKEKETNKTKIELLKLQGQLHKDGAAIDLNMFESKATDNEHARLIAHDMSMSNDSGFFGAMRKSVRPVITYLFFALFATIKITMIFSAYDNTGDLLTSLSLIWDEETAAMFSAIISFWFGSRAIEKNRK
jgi:hypothetical protein